MAKRSLADVSLALLMLTFTAGSGCPSDCIPWFKRCKACGGTGPATSTMISCSITPASSSSLRDIRQSCVKITRPLAALSNGTVAVSFAKWRLSMRVPEASSAARASGLSSCCAGFIDGWARWFASAGVAMAS